MALANRRRYSQEFKLGAVKLVTEQGYSVNEASRRLEIDRKSLSEWIVKLAPGFEPAGAHDPPEDPAALPDLLRQLRKDNERLRMEVEILKKATAYFARQSP